MILALAYADALGAGYEFFKGTIGEDEVIDFIELPKITAHKKYEWSDDTAMTFLTLKSIKLSKSGEGFIDYELLSELFIALVNEVLSSTLKLFLNHTKLFIFCFCIICCNI